MSQPPPPHRSLFWDYAALLRLPNLFTAVADVAMGFFFVQSGGLRWQMQPADAITLLLLAAVSCLLYAAGVVLNDVFDVETDRLQRPDRPIPSGRVTLATASRLGWSLLALGVAGAGSRPGGANRFAPDWWASPWPPPLSSTTWRLSGRRLARH